MEKKNFLRFFFSRLDINIEVAAKYWTLHVSKASPHDPANGNVSGDEFRHRIIIIIGNPFTLASIIKRKNRRHTFRAVLACVSTHKKNTHTYI